MSKENKSSIAEYEYRVTKVYEWLILNRWSRRDICQYVSDKTEWDVDERTVDRYIAEANKRLKEKVVLKQEEYYKKASENIDDIFKKAMSLKDVRLCKDILLAENKVLGFDKLNIHHNVEGVFNQKIQELIDDKKRGDVSRDND
ncbi:MAG: hypothetical protein KKH44_06055 [Bacteroidetes bacterium]|nr:hypothetical protein [Bacteroidota bacterium]